MEVERAIQVEYIKAYTVRIVLQPTVYYIRSSVFILHLFIFFFVLARAQSQLRLNVVICY